MSCRRCQIGHFRALYTTAVLPISRGIRWSRVVVIGIQLRRRSRVLLLLNRRLVPHLLVLRVRGVRVRGRSILSGGRVAGREARRTGSNFGGLGQRSGRRSRRCVFSEINRWRHRVCSKGSTKSILIELFMKPFNYFAERV